MSDKKTINLKYPIPIKKGDNTTEEISSIQIGRLKLKHLKSLPDDFIESNGKIKVKDLIPIVASLCEIPIESAEEIDMVDIESVSNGISDFLSQSPQIGKS